MSNSNNLLKRDFQIFCRGVWVNRNTRVDDHLFTMYDVTTVPSNFMDYVHIIPPYYFDLDANQLDYDWLMLTIHKLYLAEARTNLIDWNCILCGNKETCSSSSSSSASASGLFEVNIYSSGIYEIREMNCTYPSTDCLKSCTNVIQLNVNNCHLVSVTSQSDNGCVCPSLNDAPEVEDT